MPKLKIALIDDNQERANYIKASLIEHHFDVVACLTIDHLSMFRLEQLHADVILLDMDHPHRDIIDSCVSQFDLPTVLFTKNSHKDTIKSAINAGVTAYIVDGIDPTKLESILEIFKRPISLRVGTLPSCILLFVIFSIRPINMR